MDKLKLRLATAAAVLALSMPAAAHAYTTLWVWENAGVQNARLLQAASYAVKLLGAYKLRDVDRNYSYTVYRYYYGTKMADGKYPMVMYAKKFSDGVYRVFQFTVNSGVYATRKGVRVGSTETTLKSVYGTSLKRYYGSVYTRYSLTYLNHYGTDFYVRNSTKKVAQIVVRYY